MKTESSDEQSSSFPTPRTRTKAIDSSHSNEEVLNRRSVKDIIIHGITNNRVWIILGAAAPFYDDVFGLVSEWLADKGLQLNQLVGEQTVVWWQFGLYAFVILTMLMALVALLSVGGALDDLWDGPGAIRYVQYLANLKVTDAEFKLLFPLFACSSRCSPSIGFSHFTSKGFYEKGAIAQL